MKEFDMEVTQERLDEMKELLVKLYADQINMEVKSVRIKSKNKARTEPA